MSTSVIHPNTIQIRPSRLTGLVVGVAILAGVTTWSVSQVTTDSDGVSSPVPATDPYVDGVVALDVEQRAAAFGNVFRAQPSVQSVNAHSPELQSVSPTQQSAQSVNVQSPEMQARIIDLKAIAEMARAEGLTGLSPTSLRSPTQQSPQSVNAHSPELQAVNVSGYGDAIAGLPDNQLVAVFGTFR